MAHDLITMTDREFDQYLQTIVPWTCIWSIPGNRKIKEWTEEFIDRNGNKALVTTVEFINSKGKTNTIISRVKWLEPSV